MSLATLLPRRERTRSGGEGALAELSSGPLTLSGRARDASLTHAKHCCLVIIRSHLPPYPLLVGAFLLNAADADTRPQPAWQADVQIRTLEITKARAGINVRVVVYTEHDDEARGARLLILLPVGAAIQRMVAGCTTSAAPSMTPSLRATVTCELGSIADRGFHEVVVAITPPSSGTPSRLGVFAYSDTPDPRPGNNYAERILP